MNESMISDVRFEAGLIARARLGERVRARGHWHVECRGRDGALKWEDDFDNLVTNDGLDHILSATLAAGSQITSWYVGLTDGTPTADPGDDMSSHAGWTEVTDYDEATRQAWTAGAVSSQSVNNSASKATFTISGTVTVGGAFLVSNSTKGGSTGTLYSVGAFTGGDRAVVDDDTIQVTATFTQADDGE